MFIGILNTMKQGGWRKSSSGFTIVETLIVLTITTLLFFVAATYISGKQNRTQFTTGINSLKQQLQQLINQSATGYYPNSGDFACQGNPYGNRISFVSSATAQGTNSGCILLGKVIQFGTGTADEEQSTLGILPLAGNQYANANGDSVTAIANTQIRAIYPAGTESDVPTSSATTDAMRGNISVAVSNPDCPGIGPICYTDSATNTKVRAGAIAFVSGGADGSLVTTEDDNVQSGSQQISLYGVEDSVPNQPLNQTSLHIGNNPIKPALGLKSASSVSICIASSSTEQSGLFVIDAGLHVTLSVRTGKTC